MSSSGNVRKRTVGVAPYPEWCPLCYSRGTQIMETNKAVWQCMNDDCKVHQFFYGRKKNGKY